MEISKLFRSILWIILFIITLGLGMVGFIQTNIINPKEKENSQINNSSFENSSLEMSSLTE